MQRKLSRHFPLPTTTQELFDFAIRGGRFIVSETGTASDNLQLYMWAVEYAMANGLNPPSREDCNVFWEAEDDHEYMRQGDEEKEAK